MMAASFTRGGVFFVVTRHSNQKGEERMANGILFRGINNTIMPEGLLV